MYIDSEEDLFVYKQEVAYKRIIVIPLVSSSKQHFKNNSITSFYVHCGGKEYVFPYMHMESVYKTYNIMDVLVGEECYFYNRPLLEYNNIDLTSVHDLELAHYLNTIEGFNVEGIQTESYYSRVYSKWSKTNTLISLANFVRYCREIVKQANIENVQGLAFYTRLQSVLHMVERSGLHVDQNLFTATFGKPVNFIDGKVYTKYNLFTSTGRPSNRFGGINFAALNKADDTRKCFVSRFADGVLVEMDFKAYHPHIIASLVNYDFGDENVYEHLAKHYFETQIPTNDQITRAKEYTFNQVYGGINKKFLNIEFFAKANSFANNLWKRFIDDGWVESIISGRRFYSAYMEDMSEAKLFNYYIQMTETELNSLYLERLLPTLDQQSVLPILYTYDAVVFDCKKEYVNKLISKIIKATTSKYPISVKVGDNYKEMNNYNYEATTVVHFHDN